ncbi:MAG: potassium channel family protein [Bacteroidales bacterium]|nr:potassium channel family protein [Bacteroidales bacterium]
MNTENQEKWPQWKTTLHEVIFGTETPAGRAFDVILMISISLSVLVVIIGAIMYLVEGPDNGYRNIPESIYWTIVTLTTVGYGDISPQTGLGKVIASMVMIIGYGIIAIPTGIISAEISRARINRVKRCRNCGEDTNPDEANFCKECGSKL